MLYITSLCSAKKKISDTIGELLRLGFRNIELTGETKFYDDIEKDLFDFKKKYRLNFLVHNYFPPQINDFVLNLASGDPDLEEKTLNLVKEAVRLARKFGNDLYSLHPGFRKDLSPRLREGFFLPKGQALNSREKFYQMVNTILDEILPDGFKIALENLCPKAADDLYSFISTPADIEEFLNYYRDKPQIGLLLDLGHLNVAANCLNFDKVKTTDDLWAKYQDRIFEIHLSGNDGYKDSHRPTSVDSWQVEFLLKNKEALRTIPIVLEWHYSAGPEAYKRFETIRDKLGF